jgi:hypothetical protein
MSTFGEVTLEIDQRKHLFGRRVCFRTEMSGLIANRDYAAVDGENLAAVSPTDYFCWTGI